MIESEVSAEDALIIDLAIALGFIQNLDDLEAWWIVLGYEISVAVNDGNN